MAGKGAIAALLAVFVLGTGLAQDELEREGYFEVRSASTEVIDGVHTLDARLQLILSSEALAALEPATRELIAETERLHRRIARLDEAWRTGFEMASPARAIHSRLKRRLGDLG